MAAKSEKGKPGPKGGTAAQQASRNAEIVAAKMRGLSWSQIAATYGLSARRCQQIHKEFRESNPSLRQHDPLEIADELLEGYQADIEELVLVGATTTQDQVRVGAINSRMSARRSITELLQAMGVLPHDLGELHVAIDARITAERVIDVLTAHEIPDAVIKELREALENRSAIAAEARQLEAA